MLHETACPSASTLKQVAALFRRRSSTSLSGEVVAPGLQQEVVDVQDAGGLPELDRPVVHARAGGGGRHRLAEDRNGMVAKGRDPAVAATEDAHRAEHEKHGEDGKALPGHTRTIPE